MTGNVELIVHEVDGPMVIDWEGKQYSRGHTLKYLLRVLGGAYSGPWRHPITHEEMRVSLEEFRGRDPETTYIEIAFVSSDQADAPE